MKTAIAMISGFALFALGVISGLLTADPEYFDKRPATIKAKQKDNNGHITVKGFYDSTMN